MILPGRIDVLLKDGRYGVVLDCLADNRLLDVHFGTYTQGGEERRVTAVVGCLELKEVVGWDASGSAVTRLSTVTKRKPKARPTG